MGTVAVRTVGDILKCQISEGVAWQERADGNYTFFLEPHNLWPTQYLNDFDDSGEPDGHDLRGGMPESIVAHHFGFSPPGKARRDRVTRQTTAPHPISEDAWQLEGPVDASGAKRKGTGSKESPPVVETVALSARGFPAGRYAYAYDFADENGRPTTTSGFRFFDLLTNQVPLLPVPEIPPGAFYLGYYMTRKNGSEATARRQRRIPVADLNGRTEYRLRGPLRGGPRPSQTNLAGLSRPPAPKTRGKNPHVLQTESRFDLMAGTYTFYKAIKNGRGPGLASPPSERVVVKGDVETYREKVPVESSEARVAGPESLRAPGKRAEADYAYMGEEVDPEEARLVASINNSRAQVDHDPLILTQALNRAAYRKVFGDSASVEDLANEEGYPGNVSAVPPAQANAEKWRSVGIATEDGETVLIVGDYLEDDGVSELYCEHIADDGTVERTAVGEDEARMAVSNSWSLVSGGRMRWTYSGNVSGGSIVWASEQWNRMGVVAIGQGSVGSAECAITDGAPGSGVMARTYSDGRMILSSYYYSRATTNAKRACTTHELGHAIEFDHASTPSVMNTPIYTDRDTNNEYLTSYDKSEYTRVYGSTPNPNPNPPPDPSSPPPDPGPSSPSADEPEPQFKWVTRTRTLPYKKNAALLCLAPRAVRRDEDLEYTYFVLFEPPVGSPVSYRAYPRRSKSGPESYFRGKNQKGKKGIKIHGYSPEQEPAGLSVGLVQAELPTENLSLLAAPDPQTIPDEATPAGVETVTPGNYLITAQGIRDGGTLTVESDPAASPATGVPPFNIPTGFTARVAARKTVNLLKNAEFTETDANGTPSGWTPTNVAIANPGSYTVADGVLTLDTTPTSVNLASFPSQPIPASPDSVFTVVGTMDVTRRSSGAGRITLRQLDEAGATIGTPTVLYNLQALGEVWFKKTLAPAGTIGVPADTVILDSACSSIQLVPQIGLGADTQANLTVKFHGLKVPPYVDDVRKVVFAPLGSQEPDDFDATPADPVTGYSYAACGPAPTPAGGSQAELQTPYALETFESGAFGPGWTVVGGGATNVVEAAAALHGVNGFRVQDASAAVGWHYRYFDTPAGTQTASLGNRVLLRVAQRHAYGFVSFGPIIDKAWGLLAVWRLYQNGALTILVWNGKAYVERNVTNLSQGDEADLEIVLSGVGTAQGSISVGVGKNGQSRSVIPSASISGLDLRGRKADRPGVGTNNASDPRARYNFHFDQPVVTERGDVLNREAPPKPSGYVPPLADRPTKSTIPREFDPRQNRIGGLAYFVKPGEVVSKDLLDIPITVKPGASYTLGAFRRYSSFVPETSEMRVRLSGDGLEPVSAATFSAMNGVRGWHPVGEEDDYVTFAVPEPDAEGRSYSRCQVEVTLQGGVYYFQEFLLSRGVYADFATRDARRGFARAATGELVATLPARPPAHEAGIRLGGLWSDFGVRFAEQDDTLASVAVSYATSANTLPPGVDDYVTDPAFVVPNDYLKTRLVFSGDGERSRNVSSIYLRTWSPIGVLLREDGSHFPGVAYLGNDLWTEERPDSEFREVGGHVQVVRLTENVERIGGLNIVATTEDAIKEIAYRSSVGEPFVAELPHAENAVEGMAYTVRFGQQAEFGPLGSVSMILDGRRIIGAGCEIGKAEVLEAARNDKPRGSAIVAGA